MSTPIVLSERGKYPRGAFRTVCAKAWRHFFKLVSEKTDVAYWVIEPGAATVAVAPHCSLVYENGPDWEPPAPVIIRIDGIIEQLNESDDSSLPMLKSAFHDWVIAGILESFLSADISKLTQERILPRRDFAIVTTPHDEGLTDGELAVLWSNRKSFTVAEIRKRQLAGKKNSRKSQSRKKSSK